jgi:hypothetical protein
VFEKPNIKLGPTKRFVMNAMKLPIIRVSLFWTPLGILCT